MSEKEIRDTEEKRIKAWLDWCQSDEYRVTWNEKSIQLHKDIRNVLFKLSAMREMLRTYVITAEEEIDGLGRRGDVYSCSECGSKWRPYHDEKHLEICAYAKLLREE